MTDSSDDEVPAGFSQRTKKGILASDEGKEQFAAILKRQMQGLLMKFWSTWVDEARIFPPPWLSSSDSD